MPQQTLFRMSKMKSIFKNRFLKRWFYFFPIQLVWVHLKNNLLIVMFWLLIISLITGKIAHDYGIQHLFLSPEYLHEVSWLSYFIMGFSFGGFAMAFNISSYIMNGHRFAFLATLSRPFIKYCINNSIFPIIGILVYLFNVISFSIDSGKELPYITFIVLSFIAGYTVNIFTCFVYFLSTNKDIKKMFGVATEAEREHEEEKDEDDIDLYPHPEEKAKKPMKDVLHRQVDWDQFINMDKEWNISTYLSSPFKIRLARNIDHYDNKMLKQVFQQNHLNAALFEIIVFCSIILLSFLSTFKLFIIPAGASLILLFTLFLMLTSAIHSWFRGWADFVLITLFVAFNYLSQFDFFNSGNKAYGLNYDTTKADFRDGTLQHNIIVDNYVEDVKHTVGILDKWRDKNSQHALQSTQKPKLVFVNCSGGGLRASLWTFYSLSKADSALNGELLNHTELITGSSGGMVGAAYLRELYMRANKGEVKNIYDQKYTDNVSKDMLNNLSFHVTMNDLIFKFRHFEDNGHTYTVDRGYAFENNLNENTDDMLNKRIGEYREPEANAEIPMMIVSPTIINDGRKLLISSQPISYLSYLAPKNNIRNKHTADAIEFSRFFKEQDADNLQFTTALRMNATFPFIMPVTHLPSSPVIEVMDAGARDNFGLDATMKFIYTFRNWISANTSGIVIIQIRDNEKRFQEEENPTRTFLGELTSPVRSIYYNLCRTQDMNHDQLLQYFSECFDGEIDLVDFELPTRKKGQKLSLSWHLTESEKNQITNAFNLPNNQKSLERLKYLMRQ